MLQDEHLIIQDLTNSLSESIQRYQIVTGMVTEGIITIDETATIVSANPAIEAILGYSAVSLINQKLIQFIPKHLQKSFENFFNNYLATGCQYIHLNSIEQSVLHQDGREITVEIKIGQTKRGSKWFFTGTIQNTSQHKKENELNVGQNKLLEAIAIGAPLENILSNLITLIESQCEGTIGSVLLLNDDGIHVRHITAPGLSPAYVESINGSSIGPQAGSCGTAMYLRETVIVTDIQQNALWANYRDLANQFGLHACWSTPILSSKDKVLGSFAMYYKNVRSPKPEELKLSRLASHIAGIAIEHKQIEDQIKHLAHHDCLTGLPNRTSLQIHLGEAIAQARRHKHLVALLFIDLDKFKNINDSFGHRTGDLLLQAVGVRVRSCLRHGENVFRLGGDEFVIVLPMSTSSNEAASVARKILKALEKPFIFYESELRVGSSIGISLYPIDGNEVEGLMQAADAAMYDAKQKGRGNYQFFTNSLNVSIQNRIAIERQLRQALPQEEFTLHYQPLVEISSNRIVAAEALLRWQPATSNTTISPDQFIPIAEETGLILSIGEWVLKEACSQLKRWHDAGFTDIKMSVNLSARQIFQLGFSDIITQVLENTALSPQSLELEITESTMMPPNEENLATFRQLSKLGIRLSIDDFGTGYSSLSYLQRFPINSLKIDQSFIAHVGQNVSSSSLTEAIIAMGKSLHLDVIAEGVETTEQATFLKERGCRLAQGYLYSKPIPSAAFTELISKRM